MSGEPERWLPLPIYRYLRGLKSNLRIPIDLLQQLQQYINPKEILRGHG